MTDARDPSLNKRPEVPRRRFLGFFGALIGATGALALTHHLDPPVARRRDLPLREADFYHRHDLAG